MPLTIKFLKNPFNISCCVFCLLFLKFTFFFKTDKNWITKSKNRFSFSFWKWRYFSLLFNCSQSNCQPFKSSVSPSDFHHIYFLCNLLHHFVLNNCSAAWKQGRKIIIWKFLIEMFSEIAKFLFKMPPPTPIAKPPTFNIHRLWKCLLPSY